MTAGVGIGTMTSNFLGMSIILGYNSALDTLISQTKGAGDYKMCGVYLNRGRITMTLLFLPIVLVLLMTRKILVALGQDEEVAEFAQQYVYSFLPGLFVIGLGDC